MVRSLRSGRRGAVAGPPVGRASGKRAPVDRAEEVEAPYRIRCVGFTAWHFHEHLVRDHNFMWGYTWTKAFVQSKGLPQRASRRGAHRRKRPSEQTCRSAGDYLKPIANMWFTGQDHTINEGARMNFEDAIFVIGEPRSGTTWIGKIMDSHPDVVYRHEPDFAIYDPDLPFIVPEQDESRYTELTRQFFARLFTEPTLKAAGPPPFFPKSYHTPVMGAVRSGIITALSGIRSVSNWRRLNQVRVPDMTRVSAAADLRLVTEVGWRRWSRRCSQAGIP